MEEDGVESCWETVDLFARLSSFLSILKLCTAGLILMANIILIVVILRCPRLRRQRFHMFIISLAVADILVGLIMPLMTLALKEQMWPFGSTLCQVFTSIQKISPDLDKSLDLEKFSKRNTSWFSLSSWRNEFSCLVLLSIFKILRKYFSFSSRFLRFL